MRTRYGKLYKRRPRKYLRKSKRTKRVSNRIKRYVKKIIHSTVENKELIRYSTNEAITQIIATSPNGVPLIPQIPQGTGDNQRVGNQVRCVKGVINGRINILPYSATLNPLSTPVLVKMWFVKSLSINGQVGMTSLPWNNFFRGNGASLPFQGTMLDYFLPVNGDYWKVFATKTFKIGAGYASSTGPVGTAGYFDNSPMSVPFSFNFGRYLKKQLKFDDNTAVQYPTNDNFYVALQVQYADGSTTGLTPAEWHYVIDFKYEDA